MYFYFYLLIYLYLSNFSSSVVFIPTVEENNSAEAEIHKPEGGKSLGPKPLITEEYPFSTKAVPVLVQSQSLVSNRFFVVRHTKHQLRTRKSCS